MSLAASDECSVGTTPPFLQSFSEESQKCIRRLMVYKHPDISESDRSAFRWTAAVLVLLFERAGELRVLLTTRSKTLRYHPGETAFPGGGIERSDKSVIDAAFREAFEEVGLPLNCVDIHTIGLLDPFVSPMGIFVTPVVAVLTNLTVLDNLKAARAEVAKIFEHPLRAILDPNLIEGEPLVPEGSEDWPFQTRFHFPDDTQTSPWGKVAYRMHHFRSSATPVKGLTADILIKTAQIAYGKETTYDRYAPGQVYEIAAIARLFARLRQRKVGKKLS